MNRTICIDGRKIGSGCPCFIIAEAGVAHNGRLDLAIELVNGAALAGADAVKFQTFRAESLSTETAPKAKYQKKSTEESESQLQMLKRLELSSDEYRKVAQHCRTRKILFLSTAFDTESLRLLARLKMPAFKVASGEITNLPFLRQIAALKKPVILSTGMSYLSEVDEAVRLLQTADCNQIALLHCVSSYPADPATANLRAISTLASAFHIPIGFSDHTTGIEVPLAAVALGASIIEKHFTLDKSLPGPDHACSLSPAELKFLVQGIRDVEAALGDGLKRPLPSESDVRDVARKSIVSKRRILPGTKLTFNMLRFKRPGTGIPPTEVNFVIGRIVKRALDQDAVIHWDDLK